MAGNSARPGVSVASRVLAVLAAFDQGHRSLSLSEIARRAGLPLATTYRLAGELTAWGALSRSEAGTYTIGRRLWDVGLLAPVQTELRAVASPFLQDIYGATLATVHLGVRDGAQVLYLDRVSGHASVPVVSQIGSRLPLHATGVGKVLLAHAPDDVQRDVLASLTRVTAHTVIQPGRLAAELRRVIREGYATTSEEMSLGACSVAVPVLGPVVGQDQQVVAALGIVVPDLRRRARLIAALQVAAQGISRSLSVQ